MFNLVADKIVRGRLYPAFARHQAEPLTQAWREFGQHWPCTIPFDLHEFCSIFEFPVQTWSIDQAYPADSFYAVQIGWFDFGIDYFALLPKSVWQHVMDHQCRVLFYYNEGDNPHHIKQRLDKLAERHCLPTDCWIFVSGNSAAQELKNMCYFVDHELLYWRRNRDCAALPISNNSRPYNFTVLNRTHKWWRATVMADLKQHNILDNSLWSYNPVIDINDPRGDNPIEEDYDSNLRQLVTAFVNSGKHVCDSASSDQHNDHTRVDSHLFTDSYCQIILETHFDADSSNGVFLTEKTFKTLKHGQPFVIAGTVGSIQQLRNMGYCVFDSVIDHSYDTITNNTERWQALLTEIQRLNSSNLHEIFQACVPDLIHNQQVFLSSKQNRLQQLWQNINEKTQQLHLMATT